MIMAIDVRPEVEAELARQAALRGRPVEAYAAKLLEDAAHLALASPSPVAGNMVDLFAPLPQLGLSETKTPDEISSCERVFG